jgi:hypothetical protein
VKKRELEKKYLQFQRHQVEEKQTERQREKEEAKGFRQLAENAAKEAKVKLN